MANPIDLDRRNISITKKPNFPFENKTKKEKNERHLEIDRRIKKESRKEKRISPPTCVLKKKGNDSSEKKSEK